MKAKDTDNDVTIDFLIDRSGKTIEEWEYRQAVSEERYVFIERLDDISGEEL